MTRSQSEAIANTIIAAVAPLATKAYLESMKEQMAAETDLEAITTRIKSMKPYNCGCQIRGALLDLYELQVHYVSTLVRSATVYYVATTGNLEARTVSSRAHTKQEVKQVKDHARHKTNDQWQ